MATKTLVLNIPLTLSVEVDGDVTPESIREVIASQDVDELDDSFRDAISHYILSGETRSYEVEDEDTTIIIDV